MDAYANALRQLWTGRCTISELIELEDPVTHITATTPKVVAEDEPCRVSYPNAQNVTSARLTDTASTLNMSVNLILRPDIKIKEGSRITVTQNGSTIEYRSTGTPKVFTAHQEIIMDLVKEYA